MNKLSGTRPAAGAAPARRSVLRAGLAGMALAPLASCAATVGPASQRPPVPPKQPGEKVTLAYWTWWPNLQAVADIWNADHPEIQVRAVTIPGGLDGGYAKMFNSLTAGNQPDLAQVEYFQLPSFLLENGLENLDRYGAAQAADRIDPWLWGQCGYIGGTYGIPVDSGPMVMFYRADKYAEWGIEQPATWADYAEAARKVHADNPGAHLESFPTGDADWLAAMCMQAGARWFRTADDHWEVDLLDDASVRVARFWQDLVHDGVLNLTQNIWSTGWMEALQSGTIGTWTVANWGDAIIRGNDPDRPELWGAAPLPHWADGPAAAGVWGGSASAVLTGAPHPHEAVAFATWMSTDQRAIDALVTECGIGWSAARGGYEGSVREEPDPYFANGAAANHNDVAAEAMAAVDTDWEWGPTLSSTKNHIGDAFRAAVADKTSFVDALAAAQQNTVADMRAKGLDVRSAR